MLAMRVVLAAGRDVAGHHLADRKRERAGAVLGDGAHDVALGQDPGQAPARAADQHRADPARGQQLRRRREIRRWFDRDDVAAQVLFLAAKMSLTFMAAS